MKCLKVLVSAYACRPNEGSEAGVGWNLIIEVVKYHNIWIITKSINRPAIEAELEKNPIPGLNFVYCDVPHWKQQLQQRQRLVHLHYYLWQISAYFTARKLHKAIGFDIGHHVTYVRYSSPSFLSLLPIPFMWGPVGGGESAPKAFWQDFSLRGKVYEILRSLTHCLGECDPFTRLTAKRSILARATTEETAQRLQQLGARNVEVYSQLGLSQQVLARLQQYPVSSSSTIRFISIGRLLHWKGFHLGLRAFAQANLSDAEYWLVGNGAERERLQALAEELGIALQVKFCEECNRDRVFDLLAQCQVLVHPSLHESGGFVCLEAMASGLPVICLNLGGLATQVTAETGLKIPASSPEQAVSDLALAMVTLAQDEKMRSRMGKAGQLRVREYYNWEIKGKSLAQLYAKIVSCQSISDFGLSRG